MEVEVKAHVNNLKEIEDRLKKLGAEKIEEIYQEDIYFNAPDRDFSKTDEALRIRKIENEKTKIILTYKGPKIDKISKTREEVEVGIENLKNMVEILKFLGYKAVATIKKKRKIYKFKDFEICLDDVYKVGKFIEVEKNVKNKNKIKEYVDHAFKICKKLNIKNNFERRSYLELYLKKKRHQQ